MYAQITKENSNIDFSYEWYKVFSIDEFNKIDVPDYKTKFTIERSELRILKVESFDFDENSREFMTVQFKGDFLTINNSDGYIVDGNIGIMFLDDFFYFGVKHENNS